MTRARSLLWPAIATLVVVAILCSLGVWQVQRLQWKEALIASVNARLSAPPIAAPAPDAWPQLDLAAAEYEPVTVTGTFLHDREAHVIYALTEPKGKFGGFGFMVMTPLRTAGNWIVYVNRGFVPRDKVDPATRAADNPEGEVTVTGLLRRPAQRSWLAPADDPAANQWMSRDPALFAVPAGLAGEPVAPYIVDAAFDPVAARRHPAGRRDGGCVPQQPPRLCDHVVRPGAGRPRRLRRLRPRPPEGAVAQRLTPLISRDRAIQGCSGTRSAYRRHHPRHLQRSGDDGRSMP